MRPYLLFLLTCACALVGALAVHAQTDPAPEPEQAPVTGDGRDREPHVDARRLRKLINRYRRQIWHWQRVMGRPLTLTLRNPPAELVDRVPVWRRMAKRTWTDARHPPHTTAWRCIHRFEGAWTDGGAPFYGGLQMDLGFQQAYGTYLLRKKGTADRWTPLEQMWVAERALRAGRTFSPWPSASRSCGLM
jgi:hypothetical protein